MHGSMLGVAEDLAGLWFDSEHHAEDFHVSNNLVGKIFLFDLIWNRLS